MNKLHFNGLKNIETPKSWSEKALLIPKQAKKPEVYRVSPLKSAVIAASFILIATLSISAVLLFGNRNDAVVVPSPATAQTTVALESEKEIFDTRSTEETSAEQTETKENPTETETQVSTDAQGNTVITTVTTITTIAEDIPAEEEPDEPVSGRDETQASDTPRSDDNIPDSDEEKIIIEAIYFSRSSDFEPYEYAAGDSHDAAAASGELHGFCLIFKESGELIGESEYLHSQRFAEIEIIDEDRQKISYCPADHGIFLDPGRYRYYLLDEYMKEITYSWLEIE